MDRYTYWFQGNVSYGECYTAFLYGNLTFTSSAELPSLHPSFGKHSRDPRRCPACKVLTPLLGTLAIPTEPGGGNHTVLFTNAAATKEAHVAALQTAKALAITGARILIDDGFMGEVSRAKWYIEHRPRPQTITHDQVKKAYDEGRTTGTVGATA